MKNLLSLLTALSMVFALSACDRTAAGNANNVTEDAAAEDVAAEDAAAEDAAAEDAAAETDMTADPAEDGQNPAMNFIGPYVCDRASALVEAVGSDDARVTIEWGNSAWEQARWVMSGRLDMDTLTVEYTDCVKTMSTYGDDGALVSEEVEYEGGTGSIVFGADATFTWHDNQSDGDDMVFAWSFTAPDDADAADDTGAEEGAADETTDNDAATVSAEAEAAYQAKIEAARQDIAEGAELYSAVIPCGTGEPVLAVAVETYGPENAREAMEAVIYQYADGEVKQLALVSSTGTAYPLSFTDEAVLFGGNHTAGKLVIQDGTAELYRLSNMNIEGETAVLSVYSVADGVETLESSQEISAEDEAAYDFYTNAFADDTARVIEFS